MSKKEERGERREIKLKKKEKRNFCSKSLDPFYINLKKGI
jgi:hypothetical protein